MTLRDAIADALKRLGVQRAGSHDDRFRWSRTDLATDLAEELLGQDIVQEAAERRLAEPEARPIDLPAEGDR